jgi:3-deoxy-manno-octulosonate cytidylyltransferase (CMP-KDO synthetase)
VAEVAARIPDEPLWVNVQGDEPAIHPDALRTLVEAFDSPNSVEMATLIRPLEPGERTQPNVVKAVVGQDGFALYFSRADVPFVRDETTPVARFAHLGLYAYRRDVLLRLAALPPSPLEQAESLEQLRALENGVRIACRKTAHRSVAVDRPTDVTAAEQALAAYLRR